MPDTGTWVQRHRVPFAFFLSAPFIILAHPQGSTLLSGGLVAVTGLAIRAWAAGHIKKNRALATTGPYSYSRNPLYLGSFLVGLGFVIAANRVLLLVIFLALFAFIYIPVIRIEEQTMIELFGQEYLEYSRSVPLFFPRLTPGGTPADSADFDLRLYITYREYRASLGALAAWMLLVARSFLR